MVALRVSCTLLGINGYGTRVRKSRDAVLFTYTSTPEEQDAMPAQLTLFGIPTQRQIRSVVMVTGEVL